MKARFLTKQPPVLVQHIHDGMVDISVCVNEKACEEIVELENEKAIQHYFEYDFNQFREKEENLNIAHLEGNPSVYLTYVPEKEKALEEVVKEQQRRIDELEGCLLEVSELIYA